MKYTIQEINTWIDNTSLLLGYLIQNTKKEEINFYSNFLISLIFNKFNSFSLTNYKSHKGLKTLGIIK